MNFNRERMLSRLIEMIQIDSVSFEEKAMSDYLEKYWIEKGLEVYRDNAGEKFGGNGSNILVHIPGTMAGYSSTRKKDWLYAGLNFALSHYYTYFCWCHEFSSGYYGWRKRERNFSYPAGQSAQPPGNCIREIFFCYDYFSDKHVFGANRTQFCFSRSSLFFGRSFFY